jgi:hypothetical protein
MSSAAPSPTLAAATPPSPPAPTRPERVSSREDPDPFEAMLVDPSLHLDHEALVTSVRDMKRWTRRYLKPVLRVFSNVAVWFIIAFKRLLPFQFRSHKLIDILCVWFIRRFVSADAARVLIRHFIVETNLVSFVVNNCGADDVPDCDLRPLNLEQMGELTVIRHDLNIYNLVIDLGTSRTADVTRPRAPESLDFSMLEVPEIDAEDDRFRWLNMDIESSLYHERAVNSFQLDESLLAYIANLTGDPVYRSWTPQKFIPWLSINREVPRDLYWHAIVNEFAHERLVRMRDAVARGEPWPEQASVPVSHA